MSYNNCCKCLSIKELSVPYLILDVVTPELKVGFWLKNAGLCFVSVPYLYNFSRPIT